MMLGLTSFNNSTTKTPIRRKDFRGISYTSRVIAYLCQFLFFFVAMSTGVGRGGICLASINSPRAKTPCYAQGSWGYLLHKPSYSYNCRATDVLDSINACD